VVVKGTQIADRHDQGSAVARSVPDGRNDEFRRVLRALHSGEQVSGREFARWCDRQRDGDVALLSEVGALYAVEGHDRQGREGSCSFDLRLADESGEYDEVRVLRKVGARHAGHAELAVEPPSVVVVAGDDERSAAGGAEVVSDPSRDHGVACDQAQDRSVVRRRR
jgi:hypothetical protein